MRVGIQRSLCTGWLMLWDGRAFQSSPGIKDTEVGYIGGENENPTYRDHPGHAEGLEIAYRADETSYKNLLDCFFSIHDPNTVGSRGNDRGFGFRSALFIQNEEERSDAEEFVKIVDASGRWPVKVETRLEPFTTFWNVEDHHQDYLIKHPNGYTCYFERFVTF